MLNENRKKLEEKTVQVKKKFKLPNHIEKNLIAKKRVSDIFELIPFDVVLKDLEIRKDGSTIHANLLSDDTYIKTLQPQLLKLYEKSTVEFIDNKDIVYEALIENSNTKPFKTTAMKIYEETYITDEFIPIIRVTEQLKTLFPKNARVNFKSSFKSDVVTFNYLVNMTVTSPMAFFDIVDILNNELYSIHISYPISFVKTAGGIEMQFILQFHQPK